jgi:NAD-dependent DNA ligase
LFTGEFDFGSRSQCSKAVISLGGSVANQKLASRSIDYLVVGNTGNESWSSKTYGNKIESAVLCRKEHGKPAIVSEDHWLKALKLASPQLSLLNEGEAGGR